MSHEENQSDVRSGTVGYKPKINEVSQNFLDELQKERSRLTDEFPLCALLIEEAIDRVYSTGHIPGREFYADVLKQKPMKLSQKVFVPVKQYPKFNFTGKILGPRGNSLIRLQEETQCKIMIKGRNSMRDKVKEEDLRKSNDPRYNHLNKDLYLEISTVATPAECYARIAYALAEIRKYLIPDKNDEVSHEQLREIMEIDPDLAKGGYGTNPELHKSVFDKTIAAKGTQRYLSFLKHTSYEKREDFEDQYEYDHMVHLLPTQSKRLTSDGNEYIIVPLTSKGNKRTTLPVYSESSREVLSTKPYNSYTKGSHLFGMNKLN